MKPHAVFFAPARDERMPRGDDVNLMAAGGDGFRNRLEEGTDAVSGYELVTMTTASGMAHQRSVGRKRSRHGIISDSISTGADTLD